MRKHGFSPDLKRRPEQSRPPLLLLLQIERQVRKPILGQALPRPALDDGLDGLRRDAVAARKR